MTGRGATSGPFLLVPRGPLKRKTHNLAVTRTPCMDKRLRANGPDVRRCPYVPDVRFAYGAEIFEPEKKGAARDAEREGDDTFTEATTHAMTRGICDGNA
jgi:hypothetical protein